MIFKCIVLQEVSMEAEAILNSASFATNRGNLWMLRKYQASLMRAVLQLEQA